MEIIQIPLAGKEMANAFIIKGDSKAIIVDAGNPGSGKKIIEALSKNKIRGEDVSLILLTHAHRDHYGGAAELKNMIKAPLAIQKEGVSYVMAGRIAPIVPRGLKGIMTLPFTSRGRIIPVNPDLVFDQTIRLEVFGVCGKAISAPGHTECSSAVLLDDGQCIIGDILMFRVPFKRIPAKPLFAVDQKACLDFMTRLVGNGSRVTKIYAGHGGPWSVGQVKKRLGCPN